MAGGRARPAGRRGARTQQRDSPGQHRPSPLCRRHPHLHAVLGTLEELRVRGQVTEGHLPRDGHQAGQGEVNERDLRHATWAKGQPCLGRQVCTREYAVRPRPAALLLAASLPAPPPSTTPCAPPCTPSAHRHALSGGFQLHAPQPRPHSRPLRRFLAAPDEQVAPVQIAVLKLAGLFSHSHGQHGLQWCEAQCAAACEHVLMVWLLCERPLQSQAGAHPAPSTVSLQTSTLKHLAGVSCSRDP